MCVQMQYLENIKADSSYFVHIRVVDFCQESYPWWFHGVRFGAKQLQFKYSACRHRTSTMSRYHSLTTQSQIHHRFVPSKGVSRGPDNITLKCLRFSGFTSTEMPGAANTKYHIQISDGDKTMGLTVLPTYVDRNSASEFPMKQSNSHQQNMSHQHQTTQQQKNIARTI